LLFAKSLHEHLDLNLLADTAAALEIKTNPPNDEGEDENEGGILSIET
jgi:hypothetical protein